MAACRFRQLHGGTTPSCRDVRVAAVSSDWLVPMCVSLNMVDPTDRERREIEATKLVLVLALGCFLIDCVC